ncbi:unnamed protein product [Acanthoscelides obtectus]|uniref:DDE Tnp4 domain-containing protein n=1 Tax=Acanthoscelides obtectus TaxID=200917 RepID=A0A9P0JR55_ACAOB|nr:unnamed protein product [Acanthoscelides obtectus]CAK1625494.1 Protein ANTAGONIST OF LIKE HETEROCHROMATIN PROTEIN 1 [Acanthoscelides obtectus]
MFLSTLYPYFLESNSFLVQDIVFGRDCGVHDLNRNRGRDGEFHKKYENYRMYPDKFFEYTRMSVETFDYILINIQPELGKKVNADRILSAAEKLFLTLRFLSVGMTFRSLAQSYSLGRSTVAKTIYQTLKAIWKKLVIQHMSPKLTSEVLSEISDMFFSRWQFPNCVGAIDGKHFRIQKPPRSGNPYNYKKNFSLVLQAVSDADYKFSVIEIGGKGRQSDGGTFHFSKFNELLTNNRFHMPPPRRLPGSNILLPHVLVGNEAYPLKTYLMRPFPSSTLDDSKRIFNKRLSRAQVTIDCAYGIMTNKWRIFLKPMETDTKHAKLIIKAGCLLHNIVREKDGNSDPDFRRYMSSKSTSNQVITSRRNNRATLQAINIRNHFKDYFVTYE